MVPNIERRLTQLAPPIWRLVVDNPSPLTGPGTNTYLVGGPAMMIVDPGPADAAHRQAIITVLDTLKAAPQAIILTHHHADHSGGAESLAICFLLLYPFKVILAIIL